MAKKDKGFSLSLTIRRPVHATFSVERLKDGFAVHWDGQPLLEEGELSPTIYEEYEDALDSARYWADYFERNGHTANVDEPIDPHHYDTEEEYLGKK